MKADLFISYAWTSDHHREWVRLLASQLHLLGYTVKIDESVDYGSSLSGFMREVTNASRILLIVDENYVDRANNQPESGVGVETKWISEVYPDKPNTWLSVLFVQNPKCLLPNWLQCHKPKGFDFNADAKADQFPGAVQIDQLWRWIEGLSADRKHAVSLATARKRASRIEIIDARRDPGLYASPEMKGEVTFRYKDHQFYSVGYGEYQFKIEFSGASRTKVIIYTDSGLKAIGLITAPTFDLNSIDRFLTPGRSVKPAVGQQVVLLNSHGNFCVLTIKEVQQEVNVEEYVPEHVVFTYEIFVEG